MSEASCLAQRSDPHPAASPYYVWEAPGKPVSVRISLQVVDRSIARPSRPFVPSVRAARK